MDRSRVTRILEDWTAVTSQARRPAAPPRPVVVRGGPSGATLAGASFLVVAFVIAVAVLGRPGSNGVVGGAPTTSPRPSAAPSTPAASSAVPTPAASSAAPSSPRPTAVPSTAAAPSAVPTPTPRSTIGPCAPATLAARVTLWEGAAGHRIAHVQLTNNGPDPCVVRSMARPQLVDGHGSVLIDGASPATSEPITLAPGSILRTLVQDGNYCGPAPVAPVSVAFVLRGGGRVVASPVSPTDATVPPCLAGPGSRGDIEMHPWAS